MREYRRENPRFALCGLNCGLCPRYHTDGPSRCPGCGGPDFPLKHPSCAVITCSRKHGGVEHCFACGEFPCPRFARPSPVDSFITYRNVLADLGRAAADLRRYRKELDEKVGLLEAWLRDYDDGRRKGFYCLAVNLLSLADLRRIVRAAEGTAEDRAAKIERLVGLLKAQAEKDGVELALRR